MYPRLSDLTRDLFGFDLPVPLYTFGLMVALAIFTATAMTRRELDRMYAGGMIRPVRTRVPDAKGREREQDASPSVYIWTLMGIVAFFGILGSKLFSILDNWSAFAADPVGVFFSTSGLAFYGGLVCATLAVSVFALRKKIDLPRLADAIAPGLLLAYGIGRIGCYLSGDGDWGVCSSLADKPAWVPGFLWSETFPRNMVGMDPVAFNALERGEVCALAAPTGVYPTMLYEFAIAAALAGLMWAVRKHPYRAGWLFSVYLLFAGVERWFIEKIRVNPVTAFGLSQAEIISLGLIAAGLIGLALLTRRQTPAPPAPVAA